MRRASILLFSILTLLLAACGSDDPTGDTTQSFDEAKSSVPRDLAPDTPTGDLDQLVQDNTAFALDLYSRIIQSEEGNVFYSPFSISIALAMTYAGAEGTTETEMADVMHFDLPGPQLHQAFNALDLSLAGRGTGDASQFRLNIANALWGQTGYPFEQDFLDTIALNYGSGLFLLDFMSDPEGSRGTINEWVEEKTEERIKDLLPQGVITPNTRLVLTNAIYFWGEWVNMFSRDVTAPGSFTTPDGTTVMADFMHIEATYGYLAGTGYEAVEMPYKGEDTSMILIAPDAGTLGAFEATLDASTLDGIIAGLVPTEMVFSMPKFEFEKETKVKQILQELGLEAPFISGVADFSGLDGTTTLFITDVLHKAFVAVNEDGTEAAAATAVIMGNDSVPGTTVTIDRPFIFLIRDKVTGTILFLGRVTDPS